MLKVANTTDSIDLTTSPWVEAVDSDKEVALEEEVEEASKAEMIVETLERITN
jgi:hypothetical protein